MPEKIRRVRRKRRSQSFPGVESFPSFRLDLPPVRVALYVAAAAVAVLLLVLFGTYGSKLYTGWHESRLLKRATAMLEKKDFVAANQLARQVLEHRRDSLPAFYILAEATEKQNSEQTVSWRAQVARLQPDNIDSQLNLASAALRFGQIDLARKTLERVAPRTQDLAAFHVVAGWLARAEGNLPEQEQQFAIAVKKDPKNDLYKFNLAALQIRSQDSEKSAQARDNLERLTQVPEFHTGALRALLNDAVDRNDLQTADRFAQQLQMSPEVSFGDYLLCLNFYRKLDARKFDALLEKVKPVAARNSSDLGLLMDWMIENGLASEVVRWIDKLPDAATTKPPAAIAIAAAFVEQKNWSRLRRWTRSGSWGEGDYFRLIRLWPRGNHVNPAPMPSSTRSGALRSISPPSNAIAKSNSHALPASGIWQSKAKNFGCGSRGLPPAAAKRSTHCIGFIARTMTSKNFTTCSSVCTKLRLTRLESPIISRGSG